jgi:lysyl-tRNA synthetase class 2
VEQLKEVERLLDTIRDFYKRRGYTEVITPYLLPYPNLDENIYPVPCKVKDLKGKERVLYLHTSPEYSMKKLLAQSGRDIFQICHTFRNLEGGKLHDTEFLMLEYYKIGVDFHHIMDELGELLKTLFGEKIVYRGREISVKSVKLPLLEAFKRFLNLEYTEDEELFKENLKRAGIEFSEKDTFETLFFRAYIELEKRLGFEGPTFVYGFPERFGALARCEGGICERFELYLFGIELANGYTEINDPEDVEKRLIKTAEVLNLPVDKTFVEIHKKLPPLYSGVSVGLDRLLIIALDLETIWDLYYRKI